MRDRTRLSVARFKRLKTFIIISFIAGFLYKSALHGAVVMKNRPVRSIGILEAANDSSGIPGAPGNSEDLKNISWSLSSSSLFKQQNYSMNSLTTTNGSAFCAHKSEGNGSSLMKLKDFFREETEWKKEGIFNIFLIETSCSSWPNYRAWCSVESMAQQNPEGIVWYVLTSPEVDLREGIVEGLLTRYKNLRIVTVDLRDVFNETPLRDLYHSEAWHTNTEWPAANLSNMIRLAMVWHAGGLYSDTDIICIAPLTKLRNVIGLASFNLVNGANFHFTKHHPMLKNFMEYLNINFNPYIWGKNGPQTVSAVLRFVCQESILYSGMKCLDTEVLSHKAFNPIQPSLRNMLFQKSAEKNMNKRFPDSYTIHFWNRRTHVQPVFKESGSIYDLASASFCPFSRASATKKASVF